MPDAAELESVHVPVRDCGPVAVDDVVYVPAADRDWDSLTAWDPLGLWNPPPV